MLPSGSFSVKLIGTALPRFAGLLSAAGVNAYTTLKFRTTSAPRLPALSLAWTVNVCGPSARLLNVFGLVQAANAPPSNLHSIDATPEAGVGSAAEKPNVTEALAPRPAPNASSAPSAGPEAIDATGGTVS